MGIADRLFGKNKNTGRNEAFPFYDAENTACIACCHVMDGSRPILHASHDKEDGMWQFLCGESSHDAKDALIVSLGSVYLLDKTISPIAGLPPGFVAERDGLDSDWHVYGE